MCVCVQLLNIHIYIYVCVYVCVLCCAVLCCAMLTRKFQSRKARVGHEELLMLRSEGPYDLLHDVQLVHLALSWEDRLYVCVCVYVCLCVCCL